MQEIDRTSNPFPGLRPFESNETHLFFGRDGQSEELLRRLRRTRFLAVVGTSGSGKSSLVRAGLLPALQGGLMASAGSDWRIAIFRPGSDPIGNLARALTSSAVLGSGDEKDGSNIQAVLAETTLRRSSLGLVELVSRARTKLDQHGQALFPDYENLLVVVDQFEELFRFKQLIERENSNEDAAAFVKLLLEAVNHKAGKIYVVLTMRSDFLGDCSQFWELPEAINNGQYLIPRMTRDERREAISGPVAVGQGAISEPLVNQLLNDVGDNSDQLPILQHALMRTWDYWTDHRRNGDPIDIPDYNAIGTMSEALSRHADEAYEELNDSEKVIAEKLFKSLTERGPDNREIRRPIEVHEICDLTGADEATVISVVERFRREDRSFLMPPPTDALTGVPIHLTADSLLDISHESLIRNWARLKTWVDDESHSARIYKRLAETAVLHRAGEEALLMDPALQAALDWREKNRPNAVWGRRYHPEFETAMSYLDQSVAARDAERLEREKRLRREVTYKRSKWILVVLGLAFTLSLAALTFSYAQLRRANTQVVFALDQLHMAEEEGRRAREERNAADRKANEARMESALAREETRKAEDAQRLALKEKKLAEHARSQAETQRERAVVDQQNAIAAEKESLHRLYAADINLAQQAYQSSNTERVEELLKGTIASGGNNRGFEWNFLKHLMKSERSSVKPPNQDLLVSVTSPDGKTLAMGAGTNIKLRTISSKEEREIVLPDDFKVGSLAISPDGTKLAVGASSLNLQTTVRIFDTTSGKELRSFRKNEEAANAIAFSRPDGKQLIVGGGKGAVSIWDIDSSRKLENLPANGTVFIDVSQDGKMLAAGSLNTETKTYPVLLWDISSNDKPQKELLGHGGNITSIAFSPEGNRLATGSMDRTVRLWDPTTGYSLAVLSFPSRVFSVAFSRDSHFLAIGLEDGSIKIYDAIENLDGPTLIGHHQPVTGLSFASDSVLFSSDNKLLSRPDDDELVFEESTQTTVKEWDVGTLTLEQAPFRLDWRNGLLGNLVYSADGKILAAPALRNTTFIDLNTNKRIDTVKGQEIHSVAFSPDGKLMATAEVGQNDQNVIVIRNASDQKPIGEPIEGGVTHLAFSPNSKLLAGGTLAGEIKIWDTASSKLVSTWNTAESLAESPSAMFFRADDTVLTVHQDGVVKLWNINPQKPSVRIQLPKQNTEVEAEAVAASPDGRYFAASYKDGTALLYNSAGEWIATFKCQAEIAPTIAFSSNGRLLATGDFDGTVRVWDTTSRRELLTLRGTPYDVIGMAFSRDETKLAILDGSGYVRVWRAPIQASVASAKALP